MAREISYLSPPNFLSCSLTHIFIQPRVCVCLPFYVKEDRPRALLRRTIFQFLFCLFFSLSSLSLSIYTLIYGQTNSEKKSKKRRGIIRPGFFFGLDVDMWSKPRGILELGLGGFGVVHARESRAGGLVGLGGSYIINHETRMCFMSYQQPPFFFLLSRPRARFSELTLFFLARLWREVSTAMFFLSPCLAPFLGLCWMRDVCVVVGEQDTYFAMALWLG